MKRFHGLDVHQEYVQHCVLSAEGQILQEERLPFGALWEAFVTSLTEEDEVVMEASTTVFARYDELAAYAGRVAVVHPHKTRLIAQAHFKSDRLDGQRLAHLLRLDYLAEVWVPPWACRDLRSQLSQRQSFQKDSTRRKNVLHALVRAHRLRPPADLFSQAGRQWLREQAAASPTWGVQITTNLTVLEAVEEARAALDDHLVQVARDTPIVLRLMQQAGLDWLGALILYAASGDITRFPAAKKVSSYLGLVPALSQSGKKCYHGGITKAGRKQARWLLVEAARVAIRYDGTLQTFYERLAAKKGDAVAIVATARKLAVRVWHIWHEDENAATLDAERWARKLQRLGWRVGKERLPEGTPEFVRQTAAALAVELPAEAPGGRGVGSGGRAGEPAKEEA